MHAWYAAHSLKLILYKSVQNHGGQWIDFFLETDMQSCKISTRTDLFEISNKVVLPFQGSQNLK